MDYWWAKVTTLIGNSLGPLSASYIPPRKRWALRAEAMLLIVAYAVVFAIDAYRPAVAVDCATDPRVSRVLRLYLQLAAARTLPRGGGHVFKHTHHAYKTYCAVCGVEHALSCGTSCDAIGSVS